MNIVFYIMVIAAITVLWFVLAFIFKPVGSILYRLFEDAAKAMEEDKESKKTERKEENI